jgi:hypothetical protein
MPQLTELGLALNPSTSPLDYPGRLVRESSLLVGAWLHRMDGPDVLADGGPLGHGRLGLAEALARLGRPGPAQRRPVLAIGSNASPAQLLFKYAGLPGEPVVPITAVTVDGLAVGHSAHVSRPGYLPWAPLAQPGHRLAALLLWLDPEQLLVLDRTEPNYRRVPLPGGMAVQGGGLVTGDRCELYRSRWGLLRPGPDRPALAATSQPDVWAALLARPWFAALAGTRAAHPATVRMAATPALRDRARRALAEHGLAGPDRLDPGLDQSPPR